MTLNGIDVSAIGQGTDFNWAPYKGRISFAFIKATEGTGFADPAFARNMAQAKADGITRGAYHFLRADHDPREQAAWFLYHARRGGLGPGDLVMTDVETSDGRSAAGVSACAEAFAELVHAEAGAWPVTYTDQSMAYGGYCAGLGMTPAFIANPSRTHLALPVGPWHSVAFEQTGQRGVDVDVFHGTAAQLAELAIPHPGAPAPKPPPEWPAGVVLRFGSGGAPVEALQTALRDSGIHGVRGITVDGSFGMQTQTAVGNFQRSQGLLPDHVAGKLTRAALVKIGKLTPAGVPA